MNISGGFGKVAYVSFGLLFIGAGLNHFRDVGFYEAIIPDYIPFPRAAVLLSGVAEIMLGAGLLIPRLRRVSAWGLMALLVAVFPANIYMAMNPDLYPTVPKLVLWLRLPLQGLLILWAYAYTRPGNLNRP